MHAGVLLIGPRVFGNDVQLLQQRVLLFLGIEGTFSKPFCWCRCRWRLLLCRKVNLVAIQLDGFLGFWCGCRFDRLIDQWVGFTLFVLGRLWLGSRLRCVGFAFCRSCSKNRLTILTQQVAQGFDGCDVIQSGQTVPIEPLSASMRPAIDARAVHQ